MSAPRRSVVAPEGAEFLTSAEAAYIARVQPRTISDWVRRGWLRRYGHRGLFRVRREELLAMLASPAESEPTDTEFATATLRRIGG